MCVCACVVTCVPVCVYFLSLLDVWIITEICSSRGARVSGHITLEWLTYFLADTSAQGGNSVATNQPAWAARREGGRARWTPGTHHTEAPTQAWRRPGHTSGRSGGGGGRVSFLPPASKSVAPPAPSVPRRHYQGHLSVTLGYLSSDGQARY